jgi:hypothetical protein
MVMRVESSVAPRTCVDWYGYLLGLLVGEAGLACLGVLHVLLLGHGLGHLVRLLLTRDCELARTRTHAHEHACAEERRSRGGRYPQAFPVLGIELGLGEDVVVQRIPVVLMMMMRTTRVHQRQRAVHARAWGRRAVYLFDERIAGN